MLALFRPRVTDCPELITWNLIRLAHPGASRIVAVTVTKQDWVLCREGYFAAERTCAADRSWLRLFATTPIS